MLKCQVITERLRGARMAGEARIAPVLTISTVAVPLGGLCIGHSLSGQGREAELRGVDGHCCSGIAFGAASASTKPAVKYLIDMARSIPTIVVTVPPDRGLEHPWGLSNQRSAEAAPSSGARAVF
jgi:hypothetical protein